MVNRVTRALSAHSEMNHPLEESISLLRQQKHLDCSLCTEVHILPPEKRFFPGSLRTAPTKFPKDVGPILQDRRPRAQYLHTHVQSGDCDTQLLLICEDQLCTSFRCSSSRETPCCKPRQNLGQERPVCSHSCLGHSGVQLNGEKQIEGSGVHLLTGQLPPALSAGLAVGTRRVCLCETLTSAGGFPNYKLDFHAPAYSYINHFNTAGIPNSLPKFDLKS